MSEGTLSQYSSDEENMKSVNINNDIEMIDEEETTSSPET